MKKRLNLFSRKKRFNAFAAYAIQVKRIGTILGIILFAAFLYVIIQIFTLRTQLQDQAKKKELYLSVLSSEKDIEANIRFFKGKQTQLYNFEKDDARFAPYYLILRNVVLTSSSNSASLDTIEIDKNRDTNFVVKFQDYDATVQFLKYIESDEFLNNFESLSMASLNLSREVPGVSRARTAQKVNKNYQLQFKGRFKELNDKAT